MRPLHLPPRPYPLHQRLAPQSAPEPLASRAAWVLLWCGVLAYLTLAPAVLALLKIPYVLPGGPMPAKIHPGSYLLTLSLLLALAARGNLLREAGALFWRRPLLGLYLACMVYCGLWSLWRHGTGGAAFFIDTLWMPGVALLAMALQPRHRRRQLLLLVITALVLNGVIALVEQRLGRNMVSPFIGFDDLIPDEYFRASALFGHPLANALIVASLMPAVWLAPVPRALRVAALAVLALSMLAYGGRSATAAVVVFYGLLLAGLLLHRVLTRGLSYVQWLGGALAAVAAVLAAVGVVSMTGLGERIFSNLTWDNSANVRLVAWQALGHLDDTDWWIGVSPEAIEGIAERIGLDLRYEAIENFWIALLMQLGILGFIPFVIGLGCGVAHIWRVSAWPLRTSIVLFFVVGSGANTLASKTVTLSLLFITCQAAAAAAPRPAAGRRLRTRPTLTLPPARWAVRTARTP